MNVDWYPLFCAVSVLHGNTIFAFSWNHNYSVTSTWLQCSLTSWISHIHYNSFINFLPCIFILISDYSLITFCPIYIWILFCFCNVDHRALESTAREKQQPLEQMERMQRALDAWQSQVLRLPFLSPFLWPLTPPSLPPSLHPSLPPPLTHSITSSLPR